MTSQSQENIEEAQPLKPKPILRIGVKPILRIGVAKRPIACSKFSKIKAIQHIWLFLSRRPKKTAAFLKASGRVPLRALPRQEKHPMSVRSSARKFSTQARKTRQLRLRCITKQKTSRLFPCESIVNSSIGVGGRFAAFLEIFNNPMQAQRHIIESASSPKAARAEVFLTSRRHSA
jgi:hypothetical protein